eukprot:scaffold54757_cov18-Prasinocladus_malaysianus.AAC.1
MTSVVRVHSLCSKLPSDDMMYCCFCEMATQENYVQVVVSHHYSLKKPRRGGLSLSVAWRSYRRDGQA